MTKPTYKLRFLPIFKDDLLEITDYITDTLGNSTEAKKLVDDIEIAIDKRLENPLIFAPYQSNKIRKDTYYRIKVRNFFIFYVLIDHTMEIRRLIYSKET